jgi:Protein of unknown function (DUF1360)
MSDWLVVVLLVAATYRLTRLVVVDTFPPIEAMRDRVGEKRPGHWFTYLVNCPFCVSVWAAAFVVGVLWLSLEWASGPGVPLPILLWGGVAGLVALLYEVIDRLPDV